MMSLWSQCGLCEGNIVRYFCEMEIFLCKMMSLTWEWYVWNGHLYPVCIKFCSINNKSCSLTNKTGLSQKHSSRMNNKNTILRYTFFTEEVITKSLRSAKYFLKNLYIHKETQQLFSKNLYIWNLYCVIKELFTSNKIFTRSQIVCWNVFTSLPDTCYFLSCKNSLSEDSRNNKMPAKKIMMHQILHKNIIFMSFIHGGVIFVWPVLYNPRFSCNGPHRFSTNSRTELETLDRTALQSPQLSILSSMRVLRAGCSRGACLEETPRKRMTRNETADSCS